MKKLIPSCCFLLLSVMLISCDPNRIYDEYKTVPDGRWDKNNPVVFNFNITDTTSRYNMYINLRHGGQYQFSNLFLFVTTTLPDGKMARDTVELILADRDGRWRGSGLGDIWDHNFPFNENFRFPRNGEYKITLIQAMRIDVLPAIMDVGLRIEEAEN
jgi:gliding motility-associated lipoprotein GldH